MGKKRIGMDKLSAHLNDGQTMQVSMDKKRTGMDKLSGAFQGFSPA